MDPSEGNTAYDGQMPLVSTSLQHSAENHKQTKKKRRSILKIPSNPSSDREALKVNNCHFKIDVAG